MSKKKIIALLSGGLDSQLAVKIMQKKFDVIAVAIKTPFCDFDCGKGCGSEIRKKADDLGVDLKTVYLGDEYIKMLQNPKYKFGSGMNPCIDCRSMMFKSAKKYMKEINAEFIISGEVLGQRPMSQHKKALKIIENESNLVGKIVRPLSGKLLPKTNPEKNGLITRNDLNGIRGRTRKSQLRLAKKFEINNPPNAGGGCLLTDKLFAQKIRDLFKYVKNPTMNDIELLKVGRHFRFDLSNRLIVGRDKKENEIIESLMLSRDALFYVRDHMGPTALLRGNKLDHYKRIASQIILRYSDAPINKDANVVFKFENIKEINIKYTNKSSYAKYRISL
ncbi:MAG: tRNA (5-methylaminomethyl-2-thiouridylate)-methyltransferase [Thaumarchaeota archaeon]|nr:tRNA (5-methylaminomethyl-2-thiouridylate)-methyltransferase [Nitrososphaerota archaeon]MCY3975948.1 tRNA (5-methylaminomethyl-2-thiouridylate)-methyltransferase [Nitrososphaerota archaeon]